MYHRWFEQAIIVFQTQQKDAYGPPAAPPSSDYGAPSSSGSSAPVGGYSAPPSAPAAPPSSSYGAPGGGY